MPGFVLARVQVKDQARYAEYTKMIPQTLDAFGGRYLVRGGSYEVVEGAEEARRLVVLEFPTYGDAIAWHRSEEYAPAKKLREESAETDMVIVEGAEEGSGGRADANSFAELVRESRSYRRFTSDPVEVETLRELVDLGRLSPTTANRQQLKFLLVIDAEARERLFPALRWAGALEDWPGPAEGERPTAYIIILGDTEIAKDFDRDYPIAAQTIMLGARARELGGCMIHNCERAKIREALEIDERYEILLVLALGVPAERVELEPLPSDGSTTYWRDEADVHHVPKRGLEELIVREV